MWLLKVLRLGVVVHCPVQTSPPGILCNVLLGLSNLATSIHNICTFGDCDEKWAFCFGSPVHLASHKWKMSGKLNHTNSNEHEPKCHTPDPTCMARSQQMLVFGPN